jgi:hypothetical protein
MPRKEFEAFTRLDASDVNTYLMDQSVMSFAGTAARGSAIATPVEGMTTYLNDSNVLSVYDGSVYKTVGVGGGILQVVSTTKTDAFTSTSTSLTNITGLTATITPKFSTSKILVLLTISQIDGSSNTTIYGDVTRAGTAIGVGDTSGSKARAGWMILPEGANRGHNVSWSFLDSPATTSARTYQARVRVESGQTGYINRSFTDQDNANYARGVSTITLMEVSA